MRSREVRSSATNMAPQMLTSVLSSQIHIKIFCNLKTLSVDGIVKIMWSNSLISQKRKQRLGEIKKMCPRIGNCSRQGQDQGSAFPQCIISLPLCMKDNGES